MHDDEVGTGEQLLLTCWMPSTILRTAPRSARIGMVMRLRRTRWSSQGAGRTTGAFSSWLSRWSPSPPTYGRHGRRRRCHDSLAAELLASGDGARVGGEQRVVDVRFETTSFSAACTAALEPVVTRDVHGGPGRSGSEVHWSAAAGPLASSAASCVRYCGTTRPT